MAVKRGQLWATALFALVLSGWLWFRTATDPPAAVPVSSLTESVLDDIRGQIRDLGGDGYEIGEVSADGDVIRVNVFLNPPAVSEEVLRNLTMGVLRDVQDRIGTQVALAVWAEQWESINRREFRGMAFFSPITENYHFRDLREDHP